MKSNTISERRLAANRANAKKSTGPVSEQGRANSSRNALKHGLTATAFVLITEDIQEFNEHRDAYIARFAPRDRVELDLVNRIIHATWTENRSWETENELINLQVIKNEPTVGALYNDPPNRTRTALATNDLAKEPGVPHVQRYARSLSFQARRAYDMLMDLRKRVPLLPQGTPPEIEEPLNETKRALSLRWLPPEMKMCKKPNIWS
jgi:hypothetical protein